MKERRTLSPPRACPAGPNIEYVSKAFRNSLLQRLDSQSQLIRTASYPICLSNPSLATNFKGVGKLFHSLRLGIHRHADIGKPELPRFSRSPLNNFQHGSQTLNRADSAPICFCCASQALPTIPITLQKMAECASAADAVIFSISSGSANPRPFFPPKPYNLMLNKVMVADIVDSARKEIHRRP